MDQFVQLDQKLNINVSLNQRLNDRTSMLVSLYSNPSKIPSELQRKRAKKSNNNKATVESYRHTWATKQRLIIAIGEWHHEAYKERNKSFPAALTNDCFRRSRRSDNSEDVSKIIFKACMGKKLSTCKIGFLHIKISKSFNVMFIIQTWTIIEAKSRSDSPSSIVDSSR